MIGNVTGFFTTLLWFLVAICILVPIHEFGHFYAMRRFGVKVQRFSVGFGRRLFSWTDSKGTEFAFSAIPLGGYVKPLDERNEEIGPEEMQYALGSKPVWQRIIIYAAGPFANFILAVLFYWFLLVFKGTVSYAPIIGEVKPDSIAAQAGLAPGQEIVAIDGEAVDTRRAVAMHLLSRLGETGEISFRVKYPDSSLTYDSVAQLNAWQRDSDAPDPIEGLGFSFYRPPVPLEVGGILAGSAADKAGLKPGDTLNTIEGEQIETWESWAAKVAASPEQALQISVLRDGETLDLTLIPERLTAEDGSTFGRAGVTAMPVTMPPEMVRRHHYNPITAISSGTKETWETSAFVLLSMKKLIFGEISTKNLSGPIGIAKVAASHAEHGFWTFLSFLAHLSVVLGVLNLLPVPMLDGGHILFALVEWIKGSPVSQEVQAWSINLGIVMLFGVMAVAFYNDILRL